MNNYNKLYNKNTGEVYLACTIDCPVCKVWNKKNNIWKFFEFFPYHCLQCHHAGYSEDFILFANRVYLCLQCNKKASTELRKRLHIPNVRNT